MQFWIYKFSANPDKLYIYFTQFLVEFTHIWVSKFLHIQTIRTYNVHNFTLNLCNPYIQRISRVRIFCKSKQSVHIIYSISGWIYTIQDIQILFKSRQFVNLMYSISSWIYAILCIQQVCRVQFFCKSKHSILIMYTFPVEFVQFWIFNLSANPNNLYI